MRSPNHRRIDRPSHVHASRLVVVVLVVLLVAAAVWVVRARLLESNQDLRVKGAVLTPDRKDVYVAKSSPAGMQITAPATNTDGNLRVVYHPEGVTPTVDAESCANWIDNQGVTAQQGAALRIRTDGAGNTQAITVTKNLFGAYVWEFNVHLWISGPTPVEDLIGKFYLDKAFIPPGGGLYPLPWRMCARASGTTIDFKVWSTSRPEPAWSDRQYSASVTVPAGWVYPGSAGWYVGHLQPGHHATFTELGTWKYAPPDSNAG